MAAPTFECRLLCAARTALFIKGDGPLRVDPANPYYVGAGFISTPSAIVGGDRDVDACLVGRTVDGPIAAFRGTLAFRADDPATLVDWMHDFEAEPYRSRLYPGAVHSGFAAALDRLWPRIATALAAIRASRPADSPVILTGHSKGGALATLAAWRLRVMGVAVRVVTFAAAKAGDSEFVASYRQAAIDHVRYEYGDDLVPHLPPSAGGFADLLAQFPFAGRDVGLIRKYSYEQAGSLRYFDATGAAAADSPALADVRAVALTRQLLLMRFAQVFAEHSIDCGTGYMRAVCPVGVCPPPPQQA